MIVRKFDVQFYIEWIEITFLYFTNYEMDSLVWILTMDVASCDKPRGAACGL